MATEQQSGTQDNTAAGTAAGTSATGTPAATDTTSTGTAASTQGTSDTASQGDSATPAATGDTAATQDAPAATGTTDTSAQDATKSDAAQTPPASQSTPATQDNAKQAAVTATVRKTIVPPTAQQQAAAPAVQATPAAPAAPAPAAGVIVQKTTKTEVIDDRQLPEVVAAMKVGKPETQSALYQVIKYAEAMHPLQRVEMPAIERAQADLRVALYTLLSAEDANFKTVFRGLLAVVRAHKNNCFAVTARNRGLNTVSLQTIDNKNMRFLTKIVDLLVLTAGTNNVEQVKQHYDFSKLAEWCPNQRIQQNLTSYYA